jgi:EAL domain-containing protein (putative c-di-GMP-specific phosphodiesterase class I)
MKLDVSLTRGIDQDATRRALAAGLTSFAAHMGAAIVAEGIETADELATLRELGVGFGQGFYLGRPAPLPRG